MNRWWTTSILALLIVGLLLAGTLARTKLVEVRRAAGLVPAELFKLPPVGAASVVLLGGFRGVAVDILWIKALTYHEQRQYVEERALIELIAQVQPHFISVWAFLAQTIAYDIAVQEADPRDQWPWIQDAVAYIRKGIEQNPKSGELYFYLGQIYRHKMSQEPYFEDACERDLGANNFDAAAAAYETSCDLSWGPEFPFAPRVVAGSVYYSYYSRVEQILRRSTLTADLEFPPETLRQAEPYLAKCRAWSDRLNRDFPQDQAYVTLPARIEMALADGYLDRVKRLIVEGNYSDAAIAQARKMLDKSVLEMDNIRTKYRDARIEWVFRAKSVDAWTRIPLALVRHTGEVMLRPDKTDADVHRCAQWIRAAAVDLDRVPEAHKSDPEIASLRDFVTRAVADFDQHSREHAGQGTPR